MRQRTKILAGLGIAIVFILCFWTLPRMGAMAGSYTKKTNPLLVEVDYEHGQEPSMETLENTEDYLETVVHRDVVFWLDDEVRVDIDPSTDPSQFTDAVFVNKDHPLSFPGDYIYVICIDEDWVGIGGVACMPNNIAIMISHSTVWIHEVGHVFGLDHCTTEGCVMEETVALGTREFCDNCLKLLGAS